MKEQKFSYIFNESVPSVHAGISPPAADTPPGADPPGSRHAPGSRLQHTVNERPVRILLECILVTFLHPFKKLDRQI